MKIHSLFFSNVDQKAKDIENILKIGPLNLVFLSRILSRLHNLFPLVGPSTHIKISERSNDYLPSYPERRQTDERTPKT